MVSLCSPTFCDNVYSPEIKTAWVPKSALVDSAPGPIFADIRAGTVPTDAGYKQISMLSQFPRTWDLGLM